MDDFSKLELPEPDLSDLKTRYTEIAEGIDDLNGNDGRGEALFHLIEQWDEIRREIDSWCNLTEIRFNQDTKNPAYKAAMDRLDEIHPKLTDLDVTIKKLLLVDHRKAKIVERYGAQATELWQCQVNAFDPAVEQDLVEEAKLVSKYNELLASATFTFQGKETNLSGITEYAEDNDRTVRYDALSTMWGWFAENSDALDEIYDKMVQLRDRIAKKLKYDNFVQLAYQRMSRVDYTEQDVQQYRQEVIDKIVPLCTEIRKRQGETLQLDPLMYWDEAVHDAAGNPRPQGSYEHQIEQAQAMFDGMSPQLGEFFQLMRDKNLMDLKNRPGKAGGGFCASLLQQRVPFIFANFNGTLGDVEVFTHEIGHAYQCYSSMSQPLTDIVWPTMESCEIHSMSLEYLCWPHMEKFFGDAADRFRRIHLTSRLLFLPYGVAIDHYQHEVYNQPGLSPKERNAKWRELEELYLPHMQFGDLPHLPEGGRWQKQRHVYMSPFYYIDYTLAQCCALQFWVRSQQNFDQAVEDYQALCARGGTLPFQELARSADLKSPFTKGCLTDVAAEASKFLGL
ncbi:M3 family oligoendopeptidase [Bremerella sp. T1]|uniref:M3 family oligoendopeptidase n=1 Tax=Bremerella sp. TYQ1 TaxID=3119568 RepID=UPI001CCA98E8|nr:M3 family oligoendopeptidase [Bremerella volcania]UBM34340.1 M3 family oligoendopeptidase [Bremerella volcania]